MKKYATILLLTAALSGAVSAQKQTIDPSLSDTIVTLKMGKYELELATLLKGISQTAGYGLIIDPNVPLDKLTPVLDLDEKPFNEVWPLVMDTYNLSYRVKMVGDQPFLIVTNVADQTVLDLEAANADSVVSDVMRFFGSPVEEVSVQEVSGSALPTSTSTSKISYKLDSPTLKVFADSRNQRVIVRGTNREVAEVVAFIKDIDQAAKINQQEQIAKYGNDAFNQKIEYYRANGKSSELASFISGSFPALKVRLLPSNRGLELSGTAMLIDEALQVLAKIDPDPDGNVQRIFKLSHANADELAKTIQNTLANRLLESAVSGSDKGAEAGIKAAQQTARFIPDNRTNSLIVQGTEAQIAMATALIKELDKKVDAIKLDVMISQVGSKVINKLGMDWAFQSGGLSIGMGGKNGLSATFNPLNSVVGFNIFPALTALETQNLSKLVYKSSITLQSGDKGSGSSGGNSIRTGGVTSVKTVSADGKSETWKQFPYGLELEFVNPMLSDDGTISLTVKTRISNNKSASDTMVQQEDVKLEGKVKLTPGEPVVLSTLGKDYHKTSTNGVPLVSRIPVLGALFSSQDIESESEELVFVITADSVK